MQLPRLFWWIIATVLLLFAVAALAPQQIPVSLYKLSLVTTAGVIGYWLDRSLFPYGRPDSFIEAVIPLDESAVDALVDGDGDSKPIPCEMIEGDGFIFAMCMLRRAVIVGAAMLAIGLGA